MEHTTIDRSGATRRSSRLPQLTADRFIADGGLETSIIFQQDVDLPDFAAYVLLDTEHGRESLRRYYEPYLDLAAETETGIVLDTPTWRASLDWGTRHGYTSEQLAEVNRRAVDYVTDLAAMRPTVQAVVNGAIGPRGDGYVVGDAMSVSEASRYHDLQVRAFAQAGAAMITATTMNYVEEAIGIVRAAHAHAMPVAISFTVETDGRLPSGQALCDAIAETDDAANGGPAYYMINCAHPTHFAAVLREGSGWQHRIRGLRANASRLSHAELDAATELDAGDPDELGGHYAALRPLLPRLAVVGGCCGTGLRHVGAVCRAMRS